MIDVRSVEAIYFEVSRHCRERYTPIVVHCVCVFVYLSMAVRHTVFAVTNRSVLFVTILSSANNNNIFVTSVVCRLAG